jgi:hypothetical protein
METLKEQVTCVGVGKGYDIQYEALQRLNRNTREEFLSLTTSGKIRQFAEAHKDVFTQEELDEFHGYVDFIGLCLGFQDEVD